MPVWTKEKALPVLREKWRNGEIAALNGATTCSYRSKKGPCIIGALLDDADAEAWDSFNGNSSVWLFSSVLSAGTNGPYTRMVELFGEPNSDDAKWFCKIQEMHDSLVCTRSEMSELNEDGDDADYGERLAKAFDDCKAELERELQLTH